MTETELVCYNFLAYRLAGLSIRRGRWQQRRPDEMEVLHGRCRGAIVIKEFDNRLVGLDAWRTMAIPRWLAADSYGLGEDSSAGRVFLQSAPRAATLLF